MLIINISKLCMFLQQKTYHSKNEIFSEDQFKSVSKDIYNDTKHFNLK